MNFIRLFLTVVLSLVVFFGKMKAGFYQESIKSSQLFQNKNQFEESDFTDNEVIEKIAPVSQPPVAPIVQELTKNYNNVVQNCGTAGRPAFLCSGVIIRATEMLTDSHVWDPSLRSVKDGGVSFSYLRKDLKFRRFVHDRKSGIIYYPSMQKPEGKGRAEVLCSFPLDGWTDGREGKGGCGAHKEFASVSKECQSQGILTADTWYTHFTSVSGENNSRLKHQCGFNVGVQTPNSAQIFNESMKAQQKVSAKDYPNKQNELVIATWAANAQRELLEPEKLPIQAFFYTEASGLEEARYYQKDYFIKTKIYIPIVRVDFPDTIEGDVSFHYYGSDQNKVKCTIK